ncbi:flagellar hook capping protein [Xylophilus rhododendri]|uniref:Basal-body rod modification protein FlgD n=1 Tax=Xylophilus rhododendri TaxID=2697032 RepID=A0A857J7V8_9BURK|nr:flagellar hook capping FlgD N-terminal domain-containing protein [Xylophilus rhododendri]QHI99161.1 flagellar hook capping protein [Xylophilus rhododendri]
MSINTAAVSSSHANSAISLQDFLQVLMTQLTYQDPLKPMDNQEFMAQIAQFTTLEQTQQVNTNVQSLLANQAAQQSVGLLGRTVTVTTAEGTATGTVQGIDMAGSAPLLSIATDAGTLRDVALSRITTVTTAVP